MRLIKSFCSILSTCLILSIFISILPLTPEAQAKDLRQRLGIGFNNQFSNSTWNKPVPALSLKYGLDKDLHISGIAGFNTASPTSMTLGGKFFWNVFYENNMNFYTAMAFAYLKEERTGFEILGLLGAEFFIPGLDSLGFLFEAGASASNITGSFALKTVGYTFLQAGMHFYF